MRELRSFLADQALELADGLAAGLTDSAGSLTLLRTDAPRSDRCGTLVTHLMRLGADLRRGTHSDSHFRLRLYIAHAETARLLTPIGTELHQAIAILAAFQALRWRSCRTHPERWKTWSPARHLQMAYWNLCGVLDQVSARPRTLGTLEEHCADLGNYLVCCGVTGGVLQPAGLRHQETCREAPVGSARRRIR